jgi:hypothetical protein
MTLQEQLQRDLKEAMKAKDRLRVETIRGARAALERAQSEADKERYDAARQEAEARGLSDRSEDADESGQTPLALALAEMLVESMPLDEEAQHKVLAREVKRREEAAAMYKQAGHTEQQEREEAEARILTSYLPQQLSAEELRPQVAETIRELGVSGPAAMGQVMPVLMERFKGRADGRVLSQLAREELGKI